MMSRQTRHGMVGALLALFSCAVLSDEIRNYYEEPGITPFKSATENLNETINLFSGALQIRHVDLTLPGNGGLDIQVTRYYNHHSNVRRYPNYMSVYGVGWTMHLGRIVKPAEAGLCPTGGTTNFNPSLELADGSRHLLVLDTDGSGDYITHDNWRARCETSAGGLPYLLVISPDGTRYTMDQYMGITLGEVTEASWFTSKIEDIHGNTINISYQADALGYQYLNAITSSDGRLVEFVYDTDPNGCFKLRQMQTDGRVWMYAYEPVSGINPTDSGICGYNLTQVTLPDGRTWNYTYYPPSTSPGAYSLKSITYPYGGTVTYTYDEVVFSDVIGIPFSNTPLPDPTTVVASKTTAGPAITPGTWTYQYEPKSIPSNVDPVLTGCGYVFDTAYMDKTTVITPTAVNVYQHNSNYAVEVHAETAICYFYLQNFQVGLLSERLTYALSALDDGDLSNDTPIEKITQAWKPRRISEQPYWHGGPSWRIESDGTFVPQLTARRIWRDDPTFENALGTDYADYDHYGNAGTMIEYAGFGDSRTTRRSYFNDPNLWIIGRMATETVENVELCSTSDSACFDPPQDMTITRSHDPRNGDLLSEDRYGVLTTYTYHPSGDLHTRTDAKGNITTYTNYHRGIAQHETFEDQTDGDASRTITRVVNPAGTVASLTNGRGYTVGFSYDALNRVTGIDYPLNADVTIDWSDLALAGRRLTRQDPVQAEFVYQQVDYFDGFGRTVQTDRMGGQETITVSRQYDALGQAIFISYPNSANGTTSQFDALGRLIETRHPDGTFRQYQYAFADRIVSETDERSQTHTRYYRAFGSPGNDQVQIQLDQPVDGNNAQIINTLTFYNHLNQLTLGLQGEISGDTVYGYPRYYTYDDRGFLEKEQQPEFGTRYYTHDAVGNLKTVETINGTVGSGLTVYDYDGLNRLTHIDYPSDTPDVRRTYDANDNLTDTEKGDTHWHYEYDANDNLLQETLNLAQNSGTTRAYSLQYRYNPLDALADITYPDGTIIGYNPDPLGRATEVTDFASQVEFHPNGHLKTARLVNGQTLDIALNTRLFPEHLNVVNFAGTQIDLAYSYDGVGNVTRILDGIQSSRSVDSLKYDGMNRLTEANGSWGGGHFGYDAASNLISQTLGGQALTYHYNGMWLSALSGTVDRTYTYDIFGNVRNNGSQTFTYDWASQLTEVIDPTTGAGTHTTYQYDGHGQRTIETDALTGNRRYTLYNRAGQLLYEQDLTTCRYTDYIRLGGLLLARQDRIDDESDSDHDGLSDCQEDIYGLNPYEPDGTNDTDQDGLTDAQEIALGTDLANPDSDGDGVLDGAEVTAGTDPLSPRLWSASVDGAVLGEPALATDGTVYVGTVAGTLYAFNPDGSVRWTYATGGSLLGAPTVDSNGTLYVHNASYLYALNADGSLRWQSLALDSGRDSPALASDGTLYMGWQVSSAPDAYSLYSFKAFNPDGTERWTFKGVDGWVTSAAIGSEGTIYVASNAAGLIDSTAYLYAISAEGQFQWRFALGATDVTSSPAIGADGTIYIGSHDHHLYAINPDGTLRWTYLTGAPINSSPVLGADATVYVGSNDGYLYALNPDGSLKWRTFVYSTIDGAPAVGANGTIYVGSGDDQLYAIDPEGEIRWHFATGNDVDASPVIGPDGTVYVGSFDQSVSAFTGASGGPANSAWPLFQRDAQHRGGTNETVLPPDGDSDGDGMPNSFEQQYGLDPLDPADANEDADSDGYTNRQEYQGGTNPLDAQSFPAPDADNDGDGMPNSFEQQYGFDPFDPVDASADADNDGYTNLQEYQGGSNPLDAQSFPDLTGDSDSDGMPNAFEIQFGFNPQDANDANEDADGDGYTNLEEFKGGSNPRDDSSTPTLGDSDADGMPDAFELQYDFDINDPKDAHEDADDDGYSNWQEYRLGTNPRNRGSAPIDGSLLWTFTFMDNPPSKHTLTLALGADGTLFVGSPTNNAVSNANKVSALDRNGVEKWSYILPDGYGSLKALSLGSDGTIYLISDLQLYAISPNGILKWMRPFEYPANYLSIGPKDSLYVHNTVGYLYVYNPNDGTLQWSRKLPHSIESSIAIAHDGSMYYGGNGYLYAINSDGSSKWRYPIGSGNNGSRNPPVIAADGTIYVMAEQRLYALHPDGTLKWEDAAYTYCTGPSLDANGTIYVRSQIGFSASSLVHALNPDGSTLWDTRLPFSCSSEITSPTVSADGTVYFDNAGQYFAVSAHGAQKRTITMNDTGNYTSTSPIIGLDGTLYVGLPDGTVRAFAESNGGLALSTWPMENGNPRRTNAQCDRLGNEDADGDTLPNCWEALNGLNWLDSSDANGDLDGDGLQNLAEYQQGTLANQSDSDADGLLDGAELHDYHTNPAIKDSDGDGLGDGFEVEAGLDPLIASDFHADIDNDGLDYLAEYQAGTDPNDPDSDDDGLSDGDEAITFHTNPASTDSDKDTLGDCRELYQLGTLPTEADTDRDGLRDGFEVTNNLNPLDALHDADDDAYNDAQEVLTGSDPQDPASKPHDGDLAWSVPLESSGESPVAIGVNGTIFADDSYAQNIVALNQDGSVLKRYQVATYDNALPLTIGTDGALYIDGAHIYPDTQSLIAMNPDGDFRWQYQTTSNSRISPALAADGTIYAKSNIEDGLLDAISSEGVHLWTYKFSDSAFTSASIPAIAVDGTIYIGDHSRYYGSAGNLYALNPDGTLKWAYPIGGSQSSAIGTDGTVYVSAAGGLYAFNRNGDLLWRYDVGTGQSLSSPVIGPEGTIYAVAIGTLLAINPDGTLKWNFPANSLNSSPAIAADGTLYVSAWRHLYALNIDGTLKWELQADASEGTFSPPVIGDNGFVYVRGKAVYALVDANGGPAAGPWPMFQRDAQHTGLQTLDITLQNRQQTLAVQATPRALVRLKDQTAADLWLTRDDEDLVIHHRKATGELRLSGWFAVDVKNRLYFQDQEGARLTPQAMDRLLEVMNDDNGYTLEPWRAIAGEKISDLFRAHAYRYDDPEQVQLIRQGLQLPTADTPHSGYRLSGYLEPPASGEYTFSLPTTSTLGAGSVALYISRSEDPVSLRVVPLADEANGQVGSRVALEPGQRYYFELYRQIGAQASPNAPAEPVFWQRDGADAEPIPLEALHLHSQPQEQHALSPTVKAVMADAWSGLSQRDLEGQP